MQGFTVIDLIILIVYLAAVLFAGLHFAKREMKGKEYFKSDGTVPCLYLCNSVEPDFFPVPGRKFLCRILAAMVCSAGHAAGYSGNHQIFPSSVQ